MVYEANDFFGSRNIKSIEIAKDIAMGLKSVKQIFSNLLSSKENIFFQI